MMRFVFFGPRERFPLDVMSAVQLQGFHAKVEKPRFDAQRFKRVRYNMRYVFQVVPFVLLV